VELGRETTVGKVALLCGIAADRKSVVCDDGSVWR
jgi:hypothetical protein